MRLAIFIVVCLSILALATAVTRTRVKRNIAFRRNSKFFLRLNFKDQVMSATTYFFHAAGFKVTWDVPEGQGFRTKRTVRSLHDDLEFLYNRHGLDGSSCLARNICEATEYASRKSGVIAKILKIFTNYSKIDNDTSVHRNFDCDTYGSLCPLEFITADAVLE